MEPFIPKSKKGPEAIIQAKLMRNLKNDGWYCKSTHGNEFQAGFPDIFACNMRAGSRWIEVKCPTGYNFTQAQVQDFISLTKHGSDIWVLTHEDEIWKLHRPANWVSYLRWGSRSAPKERKPSKQSAFGPEWKIQQDVITELEKDGWYVKSTNGNIYQYGFPDLYATHPKYRSRWIEIKNPTGYVFTAAQLETFPQFTAHGVGVWIITGVGQLDLLFSPANWWCYLEIMKS